jgi:chromosome segregation ATPase
MSNPAGEAEMSAKRSPVSSAQLIKQKEEAEARLDSLRQKQVDALDEGREPEHDSEIGILNERLTAIDKAIARAEAREEETRKRTEAAAQADNLQANADKIAASERAYLEAVQKLEKHLAPTRDILVEIKSISGELFSSIARATRESNVPTFDHQNVSQRISREIGLFLSGVGVSGYYGVLQWMPEGGEVGGMAEKEKQYISGATLTAQRRLAAQIDQLRRLADGVSDDE